jgi:hypothetical protein
MVTLRTAGALRVIFLFFFLLLILGTIAVPRALFALLLLFLFLFDHVQLNRVGMHHLELDVAIGTSEDLALFDLVFVQVN